MAREAVMLWTITVISLVLLQLPYTYGQKRTGTIFKNNNHNSWSEVSEVNTDEATSEMVTATSESINETTSEMVTATSESTNETISEMVTATSESTSETTSEMVTATSESTSETTSEMVTATSESTSETTSEMVTATSESTSETTSEMVTATSESTSEITSEMVTATSESTSETTSEMTPSSGCDISIPSKVMDFCRINESVPCDEVWHHVDPKCYAIGGVAVVVVVLVLMLVVVVICCLCHCTILHSCCHYKRCCCCCHSKRCRHCRSLLRYQHIIEETDGSVEGRRTSELKDFAGCLRGERTPPPEHNDGVDRADDRKNEENVDQSQAEENFHGFFSKFNYKEEVENTQISFLGCRLQKYWYRGLKDKSPILVTQAPISRKCLFELDTKTDLMFEILKKIGQHPHIHPIWDLKIFRDHVFIVLHLRKEGSLRDKLNKSPDPTLDWGGKYGTDSYKTPLEKTLIYQYGRELSETFLYLYEFGFPPLGNVHTGNIFITEEGIELGGYENVLLGYRTRLYRDIAQEDCLRQIDGIMFGHVIFEMACGFEPGHVFPTDEDYQKVDDEVREVLGRVFDISKTEKDYIALMRKIMHIPQFNATQHASPTESEALSSGAKDLLKQVRDKVVGGKKTRKKEKEDKKVPTLTTESWKKPDNIAAAKEMFLGTQIPSIFEIGQRNERIWMIKEDDKGSTHLQTITKIPLTCPIYLSTSFQALSELTQDLAKCPFLLPLVECEYSKVNGHHLVSMLYPLQEEGSLRDVMYGTKPMDGWESKMTAIKEGRRNPLTPQIASYGHQILTAMEYLYGLGFPPLGHVHTGNIFVEGNVCRLGGYENTLLGYRTHRYDLFSSRGEKFIDVIMFGHVLYEMICMRELTTLTPSKEEYESISIPELKETLQYVFADGFVHSISDILELPFFKSSLPVTPQNPNQLQPSMRVKYLLEKVRKGKHRDQNDTVNKFRTKGLVKCKEVGQRIKKKVQPLLHPTS